MEVADHEVSGVQVDVDGGLSEEEAADMEIKPRAKREALLI
jgi:hypothetical protein